MTVPREASRELAAELARATGASFFCAETHAEKEIVRRWLIAREYDVTTPSDAWWETYLAQTARFEAVNELGKWRHIRLDAGQPLDDVVADALTARNARLNPTPVGAESSRPDT